MNNKSGDVYLNVTLVLITSCIVSNREKPPTTKITENVLTVRFVCQVHGDTSFWEFHPASCDTFYIVPTPSSHCPGEFTGVPCLTLQQYALNPSRSQNITFLFQPGIYNHSTRLTVSNGYNFTMTSTNSKVKCTSTAGQFYFNQFQNVHVSGMTFQGCNSALRMNRVSRANVTDCHFEGNRATNGRYTAGSCLFVEQSSVTISDSNFQNNIANYLGGAVYAVGSTITVSSSMNTVVPSLEGPAQTSMEGFSTRTFMHQIISSEEVSSVTTQLAMMEELCRLDDLIALSVLTNLFLTSTMRLTEEELLL